MTTIRKNLARKCRVGDVLVGALASAGSVSVAGLPGSTSACPAGSPPPASTTGAISTRQGGYKTRKVQALTEKNSPSRSIGSGAGVFVSGASRTFFGAGSGVGASSRGRLPAGSLGVALIKGRGAKEVVREGTAKKDETSKRWRTYPGSLRRRWKDHRPSGAEDPGVAVGPK